MRKGAYVGTLAKIYIFVENYHSLLKTELTLLLIGLIYNYNVNIPKAADKIILLKDSLRPGNY